jgi:hypothetical protein
MKPKMKYIVQERYVQSDEWNDHPHSKEFDRYDDAEAFAKNEMAAHHAHAYRVINRPVLDLEHGLMLYDKWVHGPFTDTDGTDALDQWLWSNLTEIFKHLQQSQRLSE